MPSCKSGVGDGWSGRGLRGCGGSSTVKAWLFIVFACCCWGDGEFQQFFSADDR